MHQVSEVGIAAHWRYKEGSKSDREYDAKLAWLRQLMDWQRDVSDATEFVEGIKLDIFQDQVFVFTPKGDVKDLPAGATPLDFAYRIHTDVGHRTIGAKVNNRLVPLDYRLKNGDIVEIVTTKAEHGPSRDWLNIVRTTHAREKIRQWFKRKERDENIVHGRESLERELRRLARTSIQAVGLERVAEMAKAYNYDSVDDFYAAMGYGAVAAQQVVTRLGVVDDAELRAPGRRAAEHPGPQRRRPGQGRRRPPRPLRQVLPPDPGRPDQRVHHPRQGRDRPPHDLPDRRQRARDQPAHRGRVGGRRPPRPTRSRSGSRRTTGPGSSPTSPRSSPRTRSTSCPPRSTSLRTTRRRRRHAPGGLRRAAGQGHGPHRAAQGRPQRPARPRLRRVGARASRSHARYLHRECNLPCRRDSVADIARANAQSGIRPIQTQISLGRQIRCDRERAGSGTPVLSIPGRDIGPRLAPAAPRAGRPLDCAACPSSGRRVGRVTCCPPSGRPTRASSGSPATSPARYGYHEIETPLFELSAVFERGIGEVTDVVEKELFRLQQRTEESETWALRPEATAGIVRAYLQHGMHTWPSAGEAHA